jgi:hypothetical protein
MAGALLLVCVRGVNGVRGCWPAQAPWGLASRGLCWRGQRQNMQSSEGALSGNHLAPCQAP